MTPLQAKAHAAVADLLAWSAAGFPGATLTDLARIANDYGPEIDAAAARHRAERAIAGLTGIRERRYRAPSIRIGRAKP